MITVIIPFIFNSVFDPKGAACLLPVFQLKRAFMFYVLHPIHPGYRLFKEKELTCSSGKPKTTFRFYIPSSVQGLCRLSTQSAVG